MRELAALQELVGRAGSYAMLNFATATADPERGALLQLVQERGTQIETALLFFELEWAALDDERAEELLADDGLDFCRHHLRSARRYRPHLLSEPEERILAEKSLTSSSAWTRLFEEQTAAIAVTLPDADEPVALEIALSRLFSPDREVRRTAAEAVTGALAARAARARLRAQHAAGGEDGRRPAALLPALAREPQPRQRGLRRVRARADRGGPRPLRAAAPLVPAQGAAARRRPARGLRPHGGGHRRGRVDPVGAREGHGARRRSPASRPELADTARAFFDERRIDAPVRPGKRGGAFCSYTVPSAAPYVLLNYTVAPPRRAHARARARPRRPRGARAPAGRLPLLHAADAGRDRERVRRDARLRPPARGGADAGVAAGPARREHRGLDRDGLPPGRDEPLRAPRRTPRGARRASSSLDRIGALWAESQEELLGDAVEVTEGYRSWWSYVPHFINSPGYVYAYAYGQLLALAVYGRYEEEGDGLRARRTSSCCRAGGSMPPEELGAIVGIDLADPGFWDRGLDLVERQLEAAEAPRATRGEPGAVR